MAQPKLRIVDESGRRRTSKFAFTVAALNAVPAPGKSRVYVYDSKQPGLALCVTSNGHRAFYFYRKVNRRPVRLKLGDFPAISIDQARRLTLGHLSSIADGDNPVEARKLARDQLTLGDLRDLYVENHAKHRLTAKTQVSEDSLWNTALKPLHGRLLADLQSVAVAKHHNKVKNDRGERTANRAISYINRLYRYAAKHYGYRGENPTTPIDPFPEQARERFLSADELPAFLKALQAEPEPFPDLITVMLLTGARSGNVRAMRWADLDLKAKLWTIPSTEAKGRRAMKIPLVGVAADILARRRVDAPDGEYVFPPLRNKGGTGHIGQPTRPFKRVCKRAGIKDLTIHDLRRTMGSWQANGGASLSIIGRSLGHTDSRATQIYARLSDDPVRASMEQAAKAMLGQKGGD